MSFGGLLLEKCICWRENWEKSQWKAGKVRVVLCKLYSRRDSYMDLDTHTHAAAETQFSDVRRISLLLLSLAFRIPFLEELKEREREISATEVVPLPSFLPSSHPLLAGNFCHSCPDVCKKTINPNPRPSSSLQLCLFSYPYAGLFYEFFWCGVLLRRRKNQGYNRF